MSDPPIVPSPSEFEAAEAAGTATDDAVLGPTVIEQGDKLEVPEAIVKSKRRLPKPRQRPCEERE